LFITGDPGKDTPKSQKILRDKKNFPESVRSVAGRIWPDATSDGQIGREVAEER
jgi:hypothetical protein